MDNKDKNMGNREKSDGQQTIVKPANWALAALISIAIMFGAWNALETHNLSKLYAQLYQIVLDGKEARILYQADNAAWHKQYDLEIKRLDKEIAEIKLQIEKIKATPKI